MIREKSLHFNCTGLVDMQPKKLLQFLTQSLYEMKQLMEEQLNLSKNPMITELITTKSTESVTFSEHLPIIPIQQSIPLPGQVTAY
ncbi:hypothetical protein K7432_015526 [Basidiobolus ranarum]|uniref:Uncharacterized protein n=1 Tax=Basidiobolus ranarum TaxID=34480 RepID=A0ABR2VP15_9FUNG